MRVGWAEARQSQRRSRGGELLQFARPAPDRRAARVIALVAGARGVAAAELLRPGRGVAKVAEARQLAMYLLHVVDGRIYAKVGRVFGRDRTTVSHACAVVEERRERAAYDDAVSQLEQLMLEPDLETRHAARR